MSSVLDASIAFLREAVAPIANEIDADTNVLRDALVEMGNRKFGALRVPSENQGPGLSESDFRVFQLECARASGTFAFLQTQHQSAAAMIMKSEAEHLRKEYLPKMVTGERWIGIGFSQLRRIGPPALTAEVTNGGYRLNGTAPWVTGFGIFHEFLVGAALEDGRAVFGLVPFTDTADPNGGSVACCEVMSLAAMEAANTVSVTFQDWFLPAERTLFVKPARWIAMNDTINITLQAYFALGCARAGLDILAENAAEKPLPFLAQAHADLEQELDSCRFQISSAQATTEEESTPERLKLRAWAIELAVRCAHAAVASSSGAANLKTHPAQRVYREALVFTVSAQTNSIMEQTLNRLVDRGT